MTQISEGYFDQKLPSVGNNEIGTLANSINALADGLRERETAKNLFGKYLSKKIAEKLISAGNERLRGESKGVAIFLSDIKNFSQITEKTEPGQLVHNLNSDLSQLVHQIEEHEGIIDKFIGDGCLAYFESTSCSKPATAALLAAIKISTSTNLNYDVGIGLHFGSVIAGNIGSPNRLEYTIIGDAVNTVARIESQTRNFQKRIVFSDDFKKILHDEGFEYPMTDLGWVTLKGKENKVRLWAPDI